MTDSHTAGSALPGHTGRDRPVHDGPARKGEADLSIEADLSVEAELGISADTGTGAPTAAELTGTDSGLRLQAARPEVLIAAAGREVATGWVDRLIVTGVRAELYGLRERVATLDPQQTSRAGALTLGNRHLPVDRAGWGVLARAAVMAPLARRRGRPVRDGPAHRRGRGHHRGLLVGVVPLGEDPVMTELSRRWRRSDSTPRTTDFCQSRLGRLRRSRTQKVAVMADVHRLPVPVTAMWDWQMRAACRDIDSAVFFHPESERGPAKHNRDTRAKRVCAHCPVIEACRRHAMSVQEPYGVWGGLTVNERDAILQRPSAHQPGARVGPDRPNRTSA